ncbi:MAG: hypothetical protein R2705_05495 [Ilumatobacteraceae bacterium]
MHTHYDGQVSWDTLMEPSSGHGVATVVIGNCGVGFAPVRPGTEWLVQLMEGVEDIPGTALHEGISWDWETFPQYLGTIDAPALRGRHRRLRPARCVRGYVMGKRGARNKPATPRISPRWPGSSARPAPARWASPPVGRWDTRLATENRYRGPSPTPMS